MNGWFCPGCKRHHAPHVQTCPAPVDAIGTKPMPVYPPTVTPYDPCYPSRLHPWWQNPTITTSGMVQVGALNTRPPVGSVCIN